MDKLEINKKKITLNGKNAVVQIISMGEEDGLTTPQLVDLFNTSQQNISKILSKYAIRSQPLVVSIRKNLLEQGVIPFRTTRVSFVPRDSIAALVKVINTPEAWAMYYQLWDDSRELSKENAELRASIEELRDFKATAESKISFMAAEIESLKNPPLKKKRDYSNKVHVRTITKQDLFGGQEIEEVYQDIPASEMTPAQKKAYKTQHSARTMEGIASKLAKDTEQLGDWISNQAKDAHASASRLKSGLLPPEGKRIVKQDIGVQSV